MRLPQRSSKAFTLIELIVVIVILGILALIAIPTFGKVITKSQDESTLSTLRAIARDAQALRALDEGSTWGTSPVDAIQETSTASGFGTVAAGTLTALLDSGVDPTVTQVSYKVSGDGLVLATRSASQRICVIGASATSVSAGKCTPAVAAGGQSTLSLTVQGDTALAPGWIFTPNAPRSVTAVAGPAAATVSWQAPTSNGSVVTGYKITPSSGQAVTAKATDTSIVVPNLTPGTPVTFTVVAVSVNGDGSPVTTNSVTPTQPIAAASTFTANATGTTANEVGLTWVKSTDAAVTKYRISGTPGIVPIEVASTFTSYSLKNLTPNVAYTFTIEPLIGTVAGTPATVNYTYFNFNNGTQNFVVPAGVTSLKTFAVGGRGGGYGESLTVKGTVPVTPGETLYVTVGGNGGSNNGAIPGSGGFNGGAGGGSSRSFGGYGGGGGTDLRKGGSTINQRILVAAGTGGAGGSNYATTSGTQNSGGGLFYGAGGGSNVNGDFAGGGGGGGYYGGAGGDPNNMSYNSGYAGSNYVAGNVTGVGYGVASNATMSFSW